MCLKHYSLVAVEYCDYCTATVKLFRTFKNTVIIWKVIWSTEKFDFVTIIDYKTSCVYRVIKNCDGEWLYIFSLSKHSGIYKRSLVICGTFCVTFPSVNEQYLFCVFNKRVLCSHGCGKFLLCCAATLSPGKMSLWGQ